LKHKPTLRLDVCDYHNTPLCNLYDNEYDISGQAKDVFVKTERNGWKELRFQIPSVLISEDGEEPNFRLDYLIADYRLRLVDDNETDWFLISEPKITHNQFSKKVEVRAGHISQLLKTKNLSLEFSDEDGNNVGTAEQLLTTILEGTGWHVGHVDTFYEDDSDKVKVRSLQAAAKTGAFKLIQDMCELFDAKPVFHGDNRTVDIIPMNPFSEVKEGEIPKEVISGMRNAVELHYDRSLKTISRTLNTENIVTKLHAEGASSGDTDLGYVNMKTCWHDEYRFSLSSSYTSGQEFAFKDKNDANYYFTIDEDIEASDILIWSKMDPASASYVWNEGTQRAYHVYKEPHNYSQMIHLESTIESKQNWFEYLMDFDYYEKVGLLTEESFQALAGFQRDCALYKEAAYNASIIRAKALSEFSELGDPQNGFLKLNVTGYTSDQETDAVVLNVDGVLYRSDYDEAERNYFQWHVAKKLKPNGDPVSGAPSVVFIIHNTDPVSWEMCYLKAVGDENGIYLDSQNEPADYDYQITGKPEPTRVWLWNALRTDGGSIPAFSSDDRFYLLCTKSISGQLGSYQVQDEAITTKHIQTAVYDTMVERPVYYKNYYSSEIPPLDVVSVQGAYGWYYSYHYDTPEYGELYFCGPTDTEWQPVYVSETQPEFDISTDLGAYFFDTKKRLLYIGLTDGWTNQDKEEWHQLENKFTKVLLYSYQRDRYYKGIYEYYNYTPDEDLPAGRYAFDSGYDFYWTFVTDRTVEAGNTLSLDTLNNFVKQDESVEHIVGTFSQPKDVTTFLSENELDFDSFVSGGLDSQTGIDTESSSTYRSQYIDVYPGETYEYNLSANTLVVFYDSARYYRDSIYASGSGTFVVPDQTNHDYESDSYKPAATKMRIMTRALTGYIRVSGYENKMYLNNQSDLLYTILPVTETLGELKGINNLTKKFADLADLIYGPYTDAYNTANNLVIQSENQLVEDLGDILREGFWQENRYVGGDEDKLYKDAIENLEKIAKPEATYDISYLDLFGSNRDMGYTVDEDNDEIEWPDIQVVDAVHLVDPEIDLNIWAFFDTIDKCYDQRNKTTVEINTNLSLIGQHSFTDVMSKIAEVSSETKYKQTIYERASAINTDGSLNTDQLKGEIAANKVMINGGASNWETTDQGHMVFYSADGLSALMITGSGVFVSSQKDAYGEWVWRTGITGYGLNADIITAGTIKAGLIEAGSITTDKLNSNVGQELEISSNKALSLFATVDGQRPSGALKTTDAMIEIKAGDGSTPAQINIGSGGELNLNAGTMTVNSQGSLDIASGGKFTIDSPNFSVDENGDVSIQGDVKAETGSIAGFTIENSKLYTQGDQSYVAIDGNKNDAYAIWAGDNQPQDAKFSVKKNGELHAESGTIAGYTINEDKLSSGSGTTYVAMDGDQNNDYAFWAGAEAPANAPFSVKKDGTIVAKSIGSFDGSAIDLTGNTTITLAVNSAVDTALETVVPQAVEEAITESIGYRMEIISTSDILSTEIKTTTLSARVWSGKNNMTDTLPASRFQWTRVSSDAFADAIWNENHKGVKSITLTTLDVKYSATYSCELADEEGGN